MSGNALTGRVGHWPFEICPGEQSHTLHLVLDVSVTIHIASSISLCCGALPFNTSSAASRNTPLCRPSLATKIAASSRAWKMTFLSDDLLHLETSSVAVTLSIIGKIVRVVIASPHHGLSLVAPAVAMKQVPHPSNIQTIALKFRRLKVLSSAPQPLNSACIIFKIKSGLVIPSIPIPTPRHAEKNWFG